MKQGISFFSTEPLTQREELLVSLLREMTCYAQYHVNSLNDDEMTESAEFTQKRVNNSKRHLGQFEKCSKFPKITN